MERLTQFHSGIWGLSVEATKAGYDRYSAFSRLAAYEDTGRMPEEIAALDHDVAMLKQSARLANELATENFRLRHQLAEVTEERDQYKADLEEFENMSPEDLGEYLAGL